MESVQDLRILVNGINDTDLLLIRSDLVSEVSRLYGITIAMRSSKSLNYACRFYNYKLSI